MTITLIIVLLLLGVAVVMFSIGRPGMDVVALIMIAALPLTGAITVPEAIAGFSDPNVVLIALLFVIGDGLVRTGVAQKLGDLLIARAGRSEAKLMLLLMVTVAGIGSVMSSTGVVAIFIPVVIRICKNAGIRRSRLMMPLSVAGLISGMMTLVATAPNLVVNGELLRAGLSGMGFFGITRFGLPILVLAMLYMLIVRRWLNGHGTQQQETDDRPQLANWIESYALAGREYRLRVWPGSQLVGRSLRDLNLRQDGHANIIAIERVVRFHRELIRPMAQTTVNTGDVLFIDALDPEFNVDQFCERFSLEHLPLTGPYFSNYTQELGMAETVVPATSRLVNKTIVQAGFRSHYDLTVIGLKRGKSVLKQDILNESLKVGDTLLVVGPWRSIRKMKSRTDDLIVLDLPVEFDDVVPAASRASFALASLAVMIVLMMTGIVPNVQAALFTCLLMGLFGCIDMTSAYRSVHWQSLVLIVGMLPFSLALQKTGGIDLAANTFVSMVGDASPRAVIAGIFILTAIFGLFISNTATAVLMAPVALAVAASMGVSPYPFAMTVALASSAAFMTPVSSPVNTLVAGVGNYTFADFIRVGVPLTIISLIVCVVLVPWFLPP